VTLSVTPPFALTERDRSLLPSDSDIEFYAEHGWYLSKLFTDDEIDDLLARTAWRVFCSQNLPIQREGSLKLSRV